MDFDRGPLFQYDDKAAFRRDMDIQNLIKREQRIEVFVTAEEGRLKKAEDYTYNMLMECGDPEGIHHLAQAMVIIRRMREEVARFAGTRAGY